MLHKVRPVSAKVSTVVLIYAICTLISFIRHFVVGSDAALFSLKNLAYALDEVLAQSIGLAYLLAIWFGLWVDWTFFGGSRRASARQAYKETLPEIERHLYEIEEFDAKLPDGPKRKKKRFGFLNWKRLSFGFKN